MILCAAGDIHGAIDRMYDDVLAFESTIGVEFESVLHVGDFGIWPDPDRIDKATRRHDGAGDFAGWLATGRSVPRKTFVIKGNHEDFDWLDDRADTEILPGLHYLANGRTIELGASRDVVRVAGLGDCYAPSDYARRSRELAGAEKAHYTSDEIDVFRGEIDVLLLHDAPAGIRFAHQQRSYVSDAAGLSELVTRVRPRICFFGHHHARVDAMVGAVPCVGLNLVGCAGNLVAIDVDPRSRAVAMLGEWPR